MKLRKRLTSLIAITLIISSTLTNIIEPNMIITYGKGPNSDVQGNSDGSGNQGTSGSGGGYTWAETKQGYRITIIDGDGEVVADPVDLLFSNPPSGAEGYYTSKVEPFGSRTNRNRRYLISEIMKTKGFKDGNNKGMPVPIKMDGSVMRSGGKALNDWLMAGESSISNTIDGSLKRPGSSSSTSSGTQRPVKGSGVVKKKPTKNSGSSNSNNYSKEVAKKQAAIQSSIVGDAQARMRKAASSGSSTSIWAAFNAGCSRLNRANIPNYLKIAGEERLSMSLSNNLRKVGQKVPGGHNTVNNTLYNIITAKSTDEKLNVKKGILKDLIPIVAHGSEETKKKGYMHHLINWTPDNKNYMVRFKDEDNSIKNGEYREDIIAANDYYILIEPIHWFVPMTVNMKSYPGGYVYGTTTNHAQWSREMIKHGAFNDGGSGGAYHGVITGTGATALKLERDQVFNNFTIKAPTGGDRISRPVGQVANNHVGYAMHTYYAKLNGTSTYDNSKGNIPHAAPDPSKIPFKDGEDKKTRRYNIVKTYEEDGEHIGTFYRGNNPYLIDIEHEIDYKVVEWIISENTESPTSITTSKTWKDVTSGINKSATGKGESTVKIVPPDVTLYVRLEREEMTKIGTEADIVIEESQITKAIETADKGILGWGPIPMDFAYRDISGSCTHCSIYSCTSYSYTLKDSSHNFIFRNANKLNNTVQTNTGVFKAINHPESGVSHSRGSTAGGVYSVNEFNYKSVIWRGKDVPTIAKYKENSGHELNSLLKKYDIKPIGNRVTQRKYEELLKIKMDKDSNRSDLRTTSGHCGVQSTSDATNVALVEYDGNVTVKSYTGKEHDKGNKLTTDQNRIMAGLLGKPVVVTHPGGTAVKGVNKFTFYPYIRMTYQKPGMKDPNRINVNVLSQWISEIYPNSYAEAAWGTTAGSSNDSYNLNISSSQWTSHKKATEGEDGWQGRNRVLPGGAIFNLDTRKQNTYASVITWQPYLEDEIANKVVIDGKTNFKLSETEDPHKKLAESAKKALDNWRVVQYVEKNTKATSAFNGLKVAGGGQNLGGLGLRNNSGTDSKYYFKKADEGKIAGQGDLDIINETEVIVKYKVKADVEGNITVLRDRDGSGWVEIDKINKTQDISSLNAESTELDKRTKVVTNLLTILTRNEGDDKTASWATSDGKWYNEAFDGICYIRRETSYEVGFRDSSIRTSALDPNLTPPSKGQSDLFNKAFISQFRMNDKSDAFTGKRPGYVGDFKGEEVVLSGADNMYRSRPFSIPNVTVQDLR